MNNFLNKFPISKEIINIFEQGLIEDRNQILMILEQYKFLSRDVIVECIADTDEYKFVNWSDFRSINSYSDNVNYLQEGNKVTVFINGYDSIDINRIELHFCNYEVTFVRVTPLNFCLMSDWNYKPVYDPMILFKRILIEAIRRHATDIHFDTKHFGTNADNTSAISTKPTYTVSFRIDSEMCPYEEFHLDARLNQEIISKLIETKTSAASLDIKSADGVTAVACDVLGTGIAELRISANKCIDGFHYVIRIQKKDTVSLTISTLGFAKAVQKDLEYVTRKRSGITFITGAVRTGKNTTAFAIENEMVKQPIKIVSYEYPVEVLMPVSQVDYANEENILLNAIRLAKKQDVNVAFLNEIPNKEVAFAVQDLVNSSIHVITTLHLDRLWLLPYRLKEYYGTSYKDVISQINAVFNQKMFSIPCPHCQNKIVISSIADERKRNLLERYGVTMAYVNTGCDKCNHTGHILGKNQPYSEHLIFDHDLASKLLRCEEPYQMEEILHETMIANKTTLETYMTAAIAEGKLAIEALDSLV